MATTNTNTGDQKILSTDIYEVSGFLDQIRADTIPDLDETSSMVGIFGYMNEMFSQSLQNVLIATAETSNEAIPTRAKFTKNVINHAMNLSITDIYAKPASMTMMFYLPVSYIEKNFVELNEVSGRGKFILDRKCPIYVGDFEFHFDYDIIINRIKNPQGNYVYTAMYDLFESGTAVIREANPISDITNPYITTVIQTRLSDNRDYVAFSARLHQVKLQESVKTVLTNNSIENKSITFTFGEQLAAFDVDVTENNKTTHLIPVYSGLIDNTLEDGEWCYYEFLDEHTIRILFHRDSYVPGLNAQVVVNIKLCDGSSGNFTYTDNFRTSLRSDKYNSYNGMYAIVYPLMNGISNGGKDKKSVAELKRIIPREASSRGAIINTNDLQNFFNSIDDTTCRLYFKKKRDNQFERMYYAYIVMRKNGYVYPTNTLNVKLLQDQFHGFTTDVGLKTTNLAIKPGTKFYYYDHGTDTGNDYATLTPPEYVAELDPDIYPYPMTINADGELVRVFEYTTPFLITVDDDLITAYLMTLMNENKVLKFVSINTAPDLEFVATNINWTRRYIPEGKTTDSEFYDNKYIMTMDIVQNTGMEYHLVNYELDDDGNKNFGTTLEERTKNVRVKAVMVLYSDETETNPYKYVFGEIADYDKSNHIYTFKFIVGTDDTMDLNNRIKITGIYNAKPETLQLKDEEERDYSVDYEPDPNHYGFMKKNTYAKIFIMADFGYYKGDVINGTKMTEDSDPILYGEDGNGNRTELETIIPTQADVIDSFLNNEIYVIKNNKRYNVVTIMKEKYVDEPLFDEIVGEADDTTSILRFLRSGDSRVKDFINNILLKDNDVQDVIASFHYEDLSRFTVCNVMAIDEGINFYHDYSPMMRSTVTIGKLAVIDSTTGLPKTGTIERTDAFGNKYSEVTTLYQIDPNTNLPVYQYKMDRVPMIRAGYLNTEELMQDYVADLEERRKYITECLYVLEDTFDIDLKFFNTYGPSRMFYYNIPSSESYKVRVALKETPIYSDMIESADTIIGTLYFGDQVSITKVKGQWGRILLSGKKITDDDAYGWIKLDDTTKVITYIDNVALTFRWALEAETSADKYIDANIIQDIKEYIEDINEVNELHIPNVITLITNNYREQLVYFEFLDVNGLGPSCQHLYLDEKISADICPEFLNVATRIDGTNSPEISITVY